MGTMVVGIFPDHSAVTNLTNAMKQNGLDIERLRIISKDEPTEELAQSGAQFIQTGEAEESVISVGSGIITSFGVDVPGLLNRGISPDKLHTASSVEDHFVDMAIPAGRWDDFATAVDAGRCVAGYNGGQQADKVRSLFSSSGGNPVDVF